MIRGLHGLLYSSEADALRAFLRDKVKLPFTDVGQGWLIFDLPEADLGVHPIDESGRPPSGTHNLSFYCDDIESTVAGMKKRGVVFDLEVADHGYGWVTYFTMPGGVSVQLYEPKYAKGPAATKPVKAKKAVPPKKAAPAKKKAAPAKKKAALAKKKRLPR